MAADEEKLIESQESEAKLAKGSTEKLERHKSEKSKAEIEADEKKLAAKGEAAERKIKAELEKKEADLAREKVEKQAEKQADKRAEKAPERKQPKTPLSPHEQKQAYHRELKKIQAQLPRSSRTFSKVVHNPVVEKVSNVADKTVLRPSVLVGGACVGIGIGALIYYAAMKYGYVFPGWLLLALLAIGGVLGLLVELIISKKKNI